jgi:RNA polymerase sigma-70 factor, ECF subfamily
VDDPAIVALLRRGDRAALAVISEHYRACLVTAAAAILHDPGEAEDVAQDVLMRVSLMRDLEIASALRPYLETAARHLAIDRLRKRARDARGAQTAARGERVEGAAESIAQSDDHARVVRDLKTLKDPYRSVLTLRYLDGFEFAEIARRLGTNERTARTWAGRGLSLLRRRAETWK